MTPDYRETTQELVDGYAIGAWPEFIALFKYLGLTDQQLRVCGIELEVSVESVIIRTINHKHEKEYLPLINLPTGIELYRTQVFKDFRNRLSIPYYLDEKRITIRICEGEQPHVIQEYAPREPKGFVPTDRKREQVEKVSQEVVGVEGAMIPTTTQHNKEFYTFSPAENPRYVVSSTKDGE